MNMDLQNQINAILENDSLDLDEYPESKCESIEGLISFYGWEPIQEILLSILLDEKRRIRDYEVAAEVFWGAVLDNRDISPVNTVIALLYHRLSDKRNSYENNLVWSITCKLKQVEYLSDYDPLNDDEIIEEMNRFIQKQ